MVDYGVDFFVAFAIGERTDPGFVEEKCLTEFARPESRRNYYLGSSDRRWAAGSFVVVVEAVAVEADCAKECVVAAS